METEGIIFTCSRSIGVAKTLGPYLIASSLRRNKISCQVIDYFDILSLDDIRNITKKFISSKTKFVGFSSTFFFDTGSNYFNIKYGYLFPHNEEYMSEFFEIFKSINSNILFIYGGTHVDFLSHKNYDNIDLYVLGNAEHFLPYYLKTTKTIKAALGNFIDCTSLDDFEIPQMKWDSNDIIDKNEYLPLETSRGCFYKCAFCKHNSFYPYKSKNVDILKSELEYNYSHFGITNYLITDSLFNANYKGLVDKLNIFINLPFEISFSCFAKLSLFSVHHDLRERFLDAGCKYIYFGIESLNNKSLKAVQKTANVEKQIDTLYYLKNIWNNKLKMGSGFIAGLPYDNENNILKWLDFLKSTENPLDEYHIQPLNIDQNGSRRYLSSISANPEKYGYILTNDKYIWKSTTSDMTRLKAKNICEETYKNKKPFWHFTSQLKNLGYTDKELSEINIYNPIFLSEMEKLRIETKNSYLKKLME